MTKRATICIGVNRAGSMTPLMAAVQSAREFEAWAKTQNCDTTLLIDETGGRVTVNDIFKTVKQVVDAAIYSQLIIYFSGHGILSAPGAEYWLLSDTPENPNEAVNLSRSIYDARNSGIPHVVFVSDACRSSVSGPPLSGIAGGVIFPNRPMAPTQADIDVYYATRPGDPAYEVPEAQATQRYRSIFTDELLKLVKTPPAAMVELVQSGNDSKKVISSRQMKVRLESTVPVTATDIDVRLRQSPQLLVETALPQYFAEVNEANIVYSHGLAQEPPQAPTMDRALSRLASTHFCSQGGTALSPTDTIASGAGLRQEIEDIAATYGRGHFETKTGFTIFGVGQVEAKGNNWMPDKPFQGDEDAHPWHVRLLWPPNQDSKTPSTAMLSFDGTTGAALAILPGFIGTVIVRDGRVISVNYVPSDQTDRYATYRSREKELSDMKAFAAVASRNGRFIVENEDASQFASRIRQDKSIDPTMGLYAAYAYAQVGKFKDAFSIFKYMREDDMKIPVLFDVVMLATRYRASAYQESDMGFAPFYPMLTQGWSLLDKDDPMYDSIHGELRPHLIPSLWTTLSATGVGIVRDAMDSGRVK